MSKESDINISSKSSINFVNIKENEKEKVGENEEEKDKNNNPADNKITIEKAKLDMKNKYYEYFFNEFTYAGVPKLDIQRLAEVCSSAVKDLTDDDVFDGDMEVMNNFVVVNNLLIKCYSGFSQFFNFCSKIFTAFAGISAGLIGLNASIPFKIENFALIMTSTGSVCGILAMVFSNFQSLFTALKRKKQSANLCEGKPKKFNKATQTEESRTYFKNLKKKDFEKEGKWGQPVLKLMDVKDYTILSEVFRTVNKDYRTDEVFEKLRKIILKDKDYQILTLSKEMENLIKNKKRYIRLLWEQEKFRKAQKLLFFSELNGSINEYDVERQEKRDAMEARRRKWWNRLWRKLTRKDVERNRLRKIFVSEKKSAYENVEKLDKEIKIEEKKLKNLQEEEKKLKNLERNKPKIDKENDPKKLEDKKKVVENDNITYVVTFDGIPEQT
jgi:hypothetical protein